MWRPELCVSRLSRLPVFVRWNNEKEAQKRWEEGGEAKQGERSGSKQSSTPINTFLQYVGAAS